MPLRIAFWNVHRRTEDDGPRHVDTTDLLVELVRTEQTDVLMLAEFHESRRVSLLEALNGAATPEFHMDSTPRFAVYWRDPVSLISPLPSGHHYALYRVSRPAEDDVLLAGCHLPCAMYADVITQASLAFELLASICAAESMSEHTRTAVVGDFNMDPYDPALVEPLLFNAVRLPNRALRGSRKIYKARRAFFYNPMWRYLGRPSSGMPPGTYRYEQDRRSIHWHVYDQVLVRPELLREGFFADDDVRVLTRVGSDSLLTRLRPDGNRLSDHLPVVLQLRDKVDRLPLKGSDRDGWD